MSQDFPETIRRWHEIVESRDLKALSDILAEDAVFESPVVFTPQKGGKITFKYLAGALDVLNNEAFHYRGHWFAERSCVMEFATTLEGVEINGVDMVTWNAEGKITHFKVMVRPLQAINLLHRLMGERLQKAG